jgi:hypothetical protein
VSYVPPPPDTQPPVVATKTSSSARSSCGLAIALFLMSIALGMMGIGKGFAILLTIAAFFFALLAGLLYVLKK